VLFTQHLRRPFPRTYPEPLVTLVTRDRFDHFLVEQAVAAGAQVYDGCSVTAPQRAPTADRCSIDFRDPRPRHCRQNVRPGRRHVCWQNRRARTGAGALCPPPASVYRGPAQICPTDWE
jgi:hypothetical protein